MLAVQVEGLSKSFRYFAVGKGITLKETLVKRAFRRPSNQRTVEALRDVSFSLDHGCMLGVIGRNGSGKTTLLRLLAGVYRPDRGRISIDGSLTPLLSLGSSFHPELTGRENVRVELLVLGLSPKGIDQRMEQIIDFSEIGNFADAPARTYSTGMRMRLAFAAAMSVDPDVVLLDEVLAVGDEAFKLKCLRAIDSFRDRGKTIILVSHSAHTVAERCDSALWLDGGRVAGFGPAAEIVAAYRSNAAPNVPVGAQR
jgi:ABC-type polysaccharide/polyol phosphate transport system ATPase subunit